MIQYEIRTVIKKTDIDWNTVAKASIDKYVWGGDYRPQAYGQAVYVAGEGFCVHMHCAEQNPTSVHQTYGEAVCCDSCMEFFCAFDAKSDKYLNVEMNAIGTSLCATGTSRYDRVDVSENGEAPFAVTAERSDDAWDVTVFLPLEKICKLFSLDASVFTAGYTFRGNFYKCGDETPVEHYGMWSPVKTKTPDYHQPSYFGQFVLTE